MSKTVRIAAATGAAVVLLLTSACSSSDDDTVRPSPSPDGTPTSEPADPSASTDDWPAAQADVKDVTTMIGRVERRLTNAWINRDATPRTVDSIRQGKLRLPDNAYFEAGSSTRPNGNVVVDLCAEQDSYAAQTTITLTLHEGLREVTYPDPERVATCDNVPTAE